MKKYIMIILSFSVCMFLLTLYLIGEKISGDRKNIERGIDLYSTYDMNDLDTNEVNLNYNNINCATIQISNLLNSNVENKINDDINNKYKYLIDNKYIEDMKYEITGNFSNIFSINISGYNSSTKERKYFYLNYNLNDGSYINFEDLFLSTVDLLPIIRTAFYNTTAKDNFLTKYEYNTYMLSYKSYEIDVHDRLASVNEDVVNNASIKFNNMNNKNFSIYDNKIYIYLSDISDLQTDNSSYRGLIKYLDYYHDMTVYNKYIFEKALFKEKTSSLKNLTVCVDFADTKYDLIEVGNKTDNMYVDFTSNKTSIIEKLEDSKKDKYIKLNDFMIKKTKNEIDDIKKKIKKDKKHMYVVFASLDNKAISNFEHGDLLYSDGANFEVVIKIYKIDKNKYDNKYYKALFESYENGLNKKLHKTINEYDINSNGIETITNSKTYYTYNFITGKEIKTLDDMFIDDAITINDLEYELRYNLEEDNVSDKEIKNILKDGIKYEFLNDGILITSISNNTYSCKLEYNDIDISCFTIYDDDIKEKYKEQDDYEINITSIVE